MVQSVIEWSVGVEEDSPGADLRSSSTKKPWPMPCSPTHRNTAPSLQSRTCFQHLERRTTRVQSNTKKEPGRNRLFFFFLTEPILVVLYCSSGNEEHMTGIGCGAWSLIGQKRPTEGLMGAVPPRLSCVSAVMSSPSRSPRRVSWFKVHKMLEFKKKNPQLLKRSGVAACCQ